MGEKCPQARFRLLSGSPRPQRESRTPAGEASMGDPGASLEPLSVRRIDGRKSVRPHVFLRVPHQGALTRVSPSFCFRVSGEWRAMLHHVPCAMNASWDMGEGPVDVLGERGGARDGHRSPHARFSRAPSAPACSYRGSLSVLVEGGRPAAPTRDRP